MAGLTSDGLEIKTAETILSEVEAEELSQINANLDVSEETPIGQINEIYSSQLDEAWQALAAVYSAAYRATASGTQLDLIGALTGTQRLEAKATTVTGVPYGNASTVLALGRVASVSGSASSRFATNAAVTLTAPAAWAASTAYAKKALVLNDTGKIYYCTQAGTSAGSGGPTGTGTNITDNTAKWSYVATAAAAAIAEMTAEATGPTVVSANSLTVIETPVSGWTGIKNPEAGITGRNVEPDEEYRARQEASLRITGAGAVDAIRADLLEVADVTACTVFENPTDVTDADLLPPHSIEALVSGGVDQDIANALWKTKPAAIATYGGVSNTVTDTAGISHTVKFSRPTAVPIYLIVDVTVDADTFPSDGAAQIKQALVDFWSAKGVGDDVIRSQLFAPIDAISGTYDVTNIKLGTAPAPAGTANITIGSRQIATFSTANITVNVTNL
jgi:uncharacterized phage protein gp47/JayE